MRAAIAIGLLCAACGGGGGDGGNPDGGAGDCTAYVVPPGTDLTRPAVSFSHDVMRLFNASCGASACHGARQSPTGGLFLGSEEARGADASIVRAGLVGVASQELPSMPLVTAGDPSRSFIMHKLDGDQCLFASQCSGGDCLALMPAGSAQPLPPVTRDALRRWIAQGAAEN